MTTHRWAPAAALAAAALLLSATAATADVAPQPTAAFAGHLVAGPGATTVKIRYTCTMSPETPFSHLFVAVKQGPHVNTTSGSSSTSADTFYSTNWKSDAGPNALRCDGVSHTQNVVLKPQPGFVPRVRRLHAGPALVQICVYDNVTQFGDEGPVDGGSAFSYTMQRVHSGH